MPNGYRRSYRAAGRCLSIALLCVSGSALAAPSGDGGEPDKQVEQQRVGAEAKQQPAVEPTPIPPVASPSSVSSEPEQRQPQTEEKANPPSSIWRDTVPQWIMAVAGIFAVLVSAVAVELLRRTLRATRDAAEYARRAAAAGEGAVTAASETAKAAKDTIIVTREIGEAQVRAYVQITKASVKFGPHPRDSDQAGPAPTFTITVSNTGNSPAIGFWWSMTLVYVWDRDSGFFDHLESHGQLRGHGILRHDERTALAQDPVDIERGAVTLPPLCAEREHVGEHEEERALNNGDLQALYVTIRTEFCDVFKTPPIVGHHHFKTEISPLVSGEEIKMRRISYGAEDIATYMAAGNDPNYYEAEHCY